MIFQDHLNKLDKGPPKEHPCKIWSQLDQRFQRRRCLKKNSPKIRQKLKNWFLSTIWTNLRRGHLRNVLYNLKPILQAVSEKKPFEAKVDRQQMRDDRRRMPDKPVFNKLCWPFTTAELMIFLQWELDVTDWNISEQNPFSQNILAMYIFHWGFCGGGTICKY